MPPPAEATLLEDALRAHRDDPADPAAYEQALERAAAAPEAAKQFLLQEAAQAPAGTASAPELPEEPTVLEVPPGGADPHAAPPVRQTPLTNWGTNIFLLAPQTRRPSSSDQAASILTLAAKGRLRARGIGAAHSSSMLVSTTGILIDSGTLAAPAASAKSSTLRQCRELTTAAWYTLDARARGQHIEVGSGARVQDVLDYLAASNRALPMTGSYTGQTLVGAFMTSTHGAGVIHPPLHAAIRSIQLLTVNEKGEPQELRIERQKGITNPTAYARDMPHVRLIQDDDVFLAVAVSMGCMGFVLSVVIATVPPYFLYQESIQTTWNEARRLLLDVGPDGVPRHFDGTYNGGVLLSPYPEFLGLGGKQRAYVTRTYLRNIPPPDARPPSGGPLSSFFLDLTKLIANTLPALVPLAINSSIEGQSTTPVWGPGNTITGSATPLPKGFSAEHAFPLRRIVPAVDAILQQMLGLATGKRKVLVGPISIRYVGATDEYMSMTHGEPRCFAEVLTLAGAGAGAEVLAAIEPTALDHGSRPHWGQWFSAAAVPRIAASYPQYARWKAVRKRLDPTGVFGNELTDKLP